MTGQQPGVAGDGTSLLLTSAKAGTVSLLRMDLATGETAALVSDGSFDAEAVFLDVTTRAPLAPCIGGARKRWKAVQEHLQPDIDAFTLGRSGDVLELITPWRPILARYDRRPVRADDPGDLGPVGGPTQDPLRGPSETD